MTSKYTEEVAKLLASLNGENNQQEEPQTTIPDPTSAEEIQDIYVVILRENPDLAEPTVIDSSVTDLDTTPLPTKQAPQPASSAATGIVPFGVFVILLCLMSTMLQLYFVTNPFTVTVALVARSQQLSVTGSLQLGRVLNPITVSQSATVPTTGRGHQVAKSATGTLTFYNGLFTTQFIAQGTIFTGQDGVQVATSESVTVPANAPPVDGHAEVAAYARNTGTSGNIQPGDINQAINNGLLVRNNKFSGGQDERDFQTVARSDIDNAATPVKSTLNQSIQGALHGQLKRSEALVTPSCTTTIASDHQAGQEATQVQVTVSETCSAVAYHQASLQTKATALLTQQAAKQVGTGYSLFDTVQVSVTRATSNHTSPPLVFLSFSAQGTWVYALTTQEQQHIKILIAGKNKQEAMQLLLSLPGVESASLHWSGFGDDTRLPKNSRYIHISIVVM